ncbi:hypothetical protein Tco_1119406, partial [Tanacetum coccineum]
MVCVLRLGLGSFIQALSLLGSWFELAVSVQHLQSNPNPSVNGLWEMVRVSWEGTRDSGLEVKTGGEGGKGFGGYG